MQLCPLPHTMSTNPVLVPVSLVSQFLASSKLVSRHWLQCQMESLLDQVFDQLSTKFEDYLANNAISGTTEHHFTIDRDAIEHEPQHEPTFQTHSHPQFQSNTDHLINTEFPVAIGQSQNRGYRGDDHVMDPNVQANLDGFDSEDFDQTLCPPSLSAPTVAPELSNQNNEHWEFGVGENQTQDDEIADDNVRVVHDEPEINEEFVDTDNEQQITTDQMSSSLSVLPSNEQSNHNLTNGDDEDEDGCDCDELCQNGIEANVEDGDDEDDYDDDEDDVQIIVDSDGPSRPPKIQRMDTTESNNRQTRLTRQSSRLVIKSSQTNLPQSDNKQTNETNEEADEMNDVNNNQDKQIITISVQCLHTGCSLVFQNKSELKGHMSTQHNILLNRCLVKDCKQSFNNKYKLRMHNKQVHSNTSQWHCDKCPKHFPTNQILINHNIEYHQLGEYKCSFANCTFTGECKKRVFNHYNHNHQPKTVDLVCQHVNCGRRFNDRSNFKRHQRVHLGIKPYRCKWPSCGYASVKRPNTIAHIRKKHLNQGPNETSLVDPQEYLEVVD